MPLFLLVGAVVVFSGVPAFGFGGEVWVGYGEVVGEECGDAVAFGAGVVAGEKDCLYGSGLLVAVGACPGEGEVAGGWDGFWVPVVCAFGSPWVTVCEAVFWLVSRVLTTDWADGVVGGLGEVVGAGDPGVSGVAGPFEFCAVVAVEFFWVVLVLVGRDGWVFGGE